MTENTKQEAALRNKTLSVLANINAVEGFDPHMVTACYPVSSTHLTLPTTARG